MNDKKPMKVLRFPTPPRRVSPLSEHLASLEILLSRCVARQSALREDGRRLQASLARLTALTRDMVRGTVRLRRTLGRLRACRGRPVYPAAPI